MITRISKIARLPHEIREQLNRRLQNGQMGRTIVKWLNDLPETKETTTEYFAGKSITHQNLSEWRRTGYQDWLQHQDRLLWFERLSEQETEIDEHNQSGDGFETMGSLFLYEIGQALNTLQHIKNPHQRCDRMQTLAREFARLQNAFNWSRRVQLEYDKHNANHPSAEPVRPNPREVETKAGGASPSAKTVPTCNVGTEAGGASVPASRARNETDPYEVAEVVTPSVPADPNSQTPKLPNSQTPNHLQPIPPPAPPTPQPPQCTPHFLEEINKIRKTRHLHPPMRGRRFICIEG